MNLECNTTTEPADMLEVLHGPCSGKETRQNKDLGMQHRQAKVKCDALCRGAAQDVHKTTY
jgi:hypothetical protein